MDEERIIVGRDAELARLFHAVAVPSGAVCSSAGPSAAEPVVVLAGEVGTGKTVLLDSTVRRAAAHGTRVLRAEGSESESGLAFSALHQLLRPARADVEELPARQRAALHAAFGTGEGTVAPATTRARTANTPVSRTSWAAFPRTARTPGRAPGCEPSRTPSPAGPKSPPSSRS
ncbi:hypothetical protein GCM10009863_00110 [Streptomyces axinellae]|uniref:Orc1-like AAA ATPase domain-containing protein n=1 Tax=Streptomyces axinellae TaxID=552788 RepID=A0ABP6BZE9_9ACTN